MVGVNCREAGELFSPCLDGEIIRGDELKLQEHLKNCPVCRREWAEWQRMADALHQLKDDEMRAPAGFSAAVMSRIKNEKVRPPRADWKRWKQAAIGAAAVLLLTFGSLLIRTDNITRIADQNKQVNQLQNVHSNTENLQNGQEVGTIDASGKKQGFQQPEGSVSSGGKVPSSGSGLNNTTSPTEFASSQSHVIISTLLKVKIGEAQKAETKAISMAQACGASVQSLGQQSEGGTVYLVDKISVEGARAQELINNLVSLGTPVGLQQDQKEDVTRRYSELYDQWIALKNERNQTVGSGQKASLDRQISQVEEQLRSWDDQSKQQTIVLWLQQ